ncbi:MAG: type I DNA topoisomerase [Thermodesulfovibrionales bacterium]|nr:type I DNA topoisomerase [Thermodesulfovibrionales bacterium]
MSSLVIVESPAKAKTIEKILGKDFTVKASVGHVKDLPKKKIGVDVENNFSPEYEVIPGKEKVIRELKAAAKRADRVFLAPDPDREGEAIAYHIASEISEKKDLNGKIFRVAFNEITERAVKEAIKNPGKIDMNKVNAQQARRILDRLVGYKLSPLLWRKVRRGLSAGRVQSVAVKIIVDREREIEAFEPEEYWMITVRLEGSSPPEFQARLHKAGGKLVIDRDAPRGERFLLGSKEAAEAQVEAARKGEFTLADIDKKLKRRMPYPPFTTSTLQQEAARKLRFSVKKTMMVAQQLYEGIDIGEEGSHGLITYMRTDSVRVAKEAQEWARHLIGSAYGKDYLPEKPPVYKSKGAAQEAHEAVRPTSPERPPQAIKGFLTKDQHNLYTLVWNRFVASQMSPAQLEQTTFTIASGGAEYRASGTVIRFNGFMAAYTETAEDMEEEEGGLLPDLKKGEGLRLADVRQSRHSTQPPPRYSEATLVKTLEEQGIGRPSTYAAILSTVVDRKYVQKTDGRFAPTELGVVVNDLLVEKFPELIDTKFTAKMEDELDRIEDGGLKWVKVVKDFYTPFSRDLDEALKAPGKATPADIATDEVCDKCGKPMIIKWGRHGRFVACSGYPECKNTRPLEAEQEDRQTDEVCDKCGSPMVLKSGRFGKFLACSGYPECKSTKSLSTGIKCPLDSGDIVERRSKKGKPFWSCGNYPKCKFATWHRPVPKKCPKCGAEFLLEKKDRQGNAMHLCHNKECGFNEELRHEGDAD